MTVSAAARYPFRILLIVGDHDHSPRGLERRGAADLPRLRGWREPRAKALTVDPLQPETGIVGQRGLVDPDIFQRCLAGKFIAKSDAMIEHAGHEVHHRLVFICSIIGTRISR